MNSTLATGAEALANVPEVMKTRLQLQWELQKANSNAPKVYKNVLDVFKKTWRMEGVKGLQRGLLPAVRLLHLFWMEKADLGFSTAIKSSSMVPDLDSTSPSDDL